MEAEERRREFLEALLRMGRPHIMQYGFQGGELTRSEYFMLNLLSESKRRFPERKGVYVSELAERMQVSSPAVSRTLRGMEHKGYLERVVDREDRRTTYIVLRPRGEDVWNGMERRAMAFMDRVMDRMGDEDTARLIALWKRLSEIVQEEQAKEN